VENRTGANGAIATQQLARMAPDGHNLMTVVSGHITNPLVSPSAGYDAIKDFTPICLVASSPLLIFAHPSFPANNMKEALDLAKAKPGTISFATPGVGSIQQLSMELVAYRSGTKFIHVPYRGGAPAVNDVVAGHVPISVNSVFQALPLIQSKALKPLAVTALKRSAVLPDVPTVAEAGVADYEATLLFGVIGPAGIPPAVVAKLNAEIVRIINTPQMRDNSPSRACCRSPARRRNSPPPCSPSRKNGPRSSRPPTSRNSHDNPPPPFPPACGWRACPARVIEALHGAGLSRASGEVHGRLRAGRAE
jgi:tripartite-type tricarboxylate transporter receptor subunit TctC